ncbi:hypothetical protein [Rhizobium leguminosarum]|uniref:hypothetical protein n=1 Tax=Rhizobium leguminosarum TaxID=384 RepID=UPI001C977E19|nr:hypothetical protein [Rhizobium leguminosarum]MBY5318223.1 hypothetical protein [Rhizobium leguminosarum]
MTDRFRKGFDPIQHGLLRTLYGDLVPPVQMLVVRPGLYRVVDHMFANLGRLSDRRSLRVARVESRNAGFLQVVTTGGARGADDIISITEDEARHTCEHCGKPARLVVKVGLEALLTTPEIELGDRLLCTDCAHEFQKEIAHDDR